LRGALAAIVAAPHLCAMTQLDAIPDDLARAYSAGTIMRSEIADRLDRHVGFGEVLLALSRLDLTFPRIDHPGKEAAVALIADAVRRSSP
jgi:hypothetical protein